MIPSWFLVLLADVVGHTVVAVGVTVVPAPVLFDRVWLVAVIFSLEYIIIFHWFRCHCTGCC